MRNHAVSTLPSRDGCSGRALVVSYQACIYCATALMWLRPAPVCGFQREHSRRSSSVCLFLFRRSLRFYVIDTYVFSSVSNLQYIGYPFVFRHILLFVRFLCIYIRLLRRFFFVSPSAFPACLPPPPPTFFLLPYTPPPPSRLHLFPLFPKK